MKKIILFTLALSLFISKADEGMYLPFQLKNNAKDMKKAGIKISPSKIYNPDKPSVKDAIVALGGFCTAEIISPKGLMLTNHHCGYDAIRSNSTPQNDYLTNGFWAMKHSEELPIEGLTATIVVKIIDVTHLILPNLGANLDEDERNLRIKQISEELIKKEIAGTHYRAYIKDFYEGNEFYLFVNEVFEDVRLVGAPPSSIGKYGGDTDNWMWTRHTGDFTMFRIYAGKDNKPSKFAMDNVPYTPKHHLPISLKGIEDGDFAMVMGFPGSTDRYLTSYGIELATEKDQPSRVKIRGEKLRIMKEDMDQSDVVRIQYASTYAQVSNYWKYFIGQTEQLKKNKVWEKKKMIENEFTTWVNQNEDRKKKYGNVLSDVESSYKVLTTYNPTQVYFFESVYSIAYNKFMASHLQLYNLLKDENPNEEKINQAKEDLKKSSIAFFKKFNLTTEIKLNAKMYELYVENVPVDQHPDKLRDINNELKGKYKDFITSQMENSIFSSPENYANFISNPSLEDFENDKLFDLNKEMLYNFRKLIYGPEVNNAQTKLDLANRLFIAALREIYPSKKFYPNANFTLRLTYGTVGSYRPKDGVIYDYYTTIDGLMAKEDPNNEEFIVPAKLKELYEKKDYGRYGKDGNLWVNFISNNDITGGNSGSPVMNSKGHLIGLAFDGNWEAMSGDIAFEDKLQRTISVDIRYVLFIVDKYAGAQNLIDEMTIIQ